VRRQQFRATYPAALSEVFAALSITLAYRRWYPPDEPPRAGHRYSHRTGSVLRVGRVVDVVRPCGLTLEEVLHDAPCRVRLLLRWRIEPLQEGCSVRLDLRYRLNRAATLRFGHWEQRLRLHFGRQLEFVGLHLGRLHQQAKLLQARKSS
jgi:hypothetical protein